MDNVNDAVISDLAEAVERAFDGADEDQVKQDAVDLQKRHRLSAESAGRVEALLRKVSGLDKKSGRKAAAESGDDKESKSEKASSKAGKSNK